MGKGKAIPSRDGFTYTALVGTTLERHELVNAIAAAINNSTRKCTGEWITDRKYRIIQGGLQTRFELRGARELFFQVVLYSTADIPEQEVKGLLLSIGDTVSDPDVYQVRDFPQKEKKIWSEQYDSELYFIDIYAAQDERNSEAEQLALEGEAAYHSNLWEKETRRCSDGSIFPEAEFYDDDRDSVLMSSQWYPASGGRGHTF
jgi:hypothetical protein